MDAMTLPMHLPPIADLLAVPALAERPEDLNVVTVSPGVAGFVAIFVVAVVTILLARNMMRRVRRIHLSERDRLAVEERIEERAAEDGAEGGRPGEGSPSDPDARDDAATRRPDAGRPDAGRPDAD
jgi:hypothetical protein